MVIEISGAETLNYDANSSSYLELIAISERLSQKDATLWGEAASKEAAIRLNWVDLPINSMSLIPALEELAHWAHLNKLTNIILCGMGGSSLAPEVLSKVYSKNLTVLDTTNPDQIHGAIPDDLTNSVVVVSSKSGSTIETASQLSLFTKLFKDSGLNPADHFIIVTDPGSPLDLNSKKNGYRVVNADPNVGGRYSALTAFGLVPAALMGIDIAQLLSDAQSASAEFLKPNSPAALLAALIFDYKAQAVAFSDSESKLPGISDWIEQLIAESTGKEGVGRLPIVIESANAPIAGRALRITFEERAGDVCVEAPLGAQFILWEWVTALLSYLLKIDPFNQPNVTEAKEQTANILENWNDLEIATPDFVDDDFEIFGANSIDDVLLKLSGEYIAIMAYLDRYQDVKISEIRSLFATKKGVPVTFGWGPRFLHSTGQFHKGGQPNGAFLQITATSKNDIAIPDRDFTFQKLIMAQALGDAKALSKRNYPLVRIHLKNRDKAIFRILKSFA